VRVPHDLRERVGVLEVRRSLHVHSLSIARPLALKYGARVMELFEMIGREHLTKERTRELVTGCFSDLAATADRGFVPRSDRPDLEIAEQRDAAHDSIGDLSDQIAHWNFSPRVEYVADQIVQEAGLKLDDLHSASKQDLLVGTARALIEQQRLFLYRLTDRLGPYVPADDLFVRQRHYQPPWAHAPADQFHQAVAAAGSKVVISMEALVNAFLTAKKPDWAVKTLANRTHHLNYLLDHVGKGTPAVAISPDDIRGFRDGLRRLRLDHHKRGKATFAERQTAKEAERIEPKTASLHFDT